MRRYHVPPDDAEALVHDIFAAYLQRSAYVRDVKGWLIGAIGNASQNYVRKRKPKPSSCRSTKRRSTPAAEASLDRCDAPPHDCRRCSARLGDKCRETLRRYYLREEPKEQIAAHLETSPAYVLQLLVTCRKRAQEILRSLSGNEE